MNAQIAKFSVGRLKAFLDCQFGAGALCTERGGGGQLNPAFFVDHGSKRMVLRKKAAGKLLPSAHAVEGEFRVIKLYCRLKFLYRACAALPRDGHFSTQNSYRLRASRCDCCQ